MARSVRFDLIADADKFSKGMRQAQKSTEGFTQHTSRAGSALKAAFATFSAGVVIAGLKSTVDAASAMNETASKTKVVFGPAAKGVEDFAKRAATSLGLSRQEAEESAATFGNLFVSMKIGAPKAAEMSTRMVQLAGDLASFNNANPQDTLEALRSGLVGETEPLRRFGINLNDADLRQKAMSLGLVKTTKDVLPPAVKAQAAYALILEQSKTAQGDFARTSGGLANQQRILAAKIKDLKATIGSALLPAVLKGVAAFNSFLGVVDRNKTAFGVLFGVLGAGGAVIGGLVLIGKTHKAVTEGVAAVTEAWKTAQKGLNTVLGVTKVQATAAAVATEAQATATVAASTAAQTALPLVSKLALGIGAVVIAIHALTQKSRDYNEVGKSTNEAVSRYGLVAGLTASQVAKLKGAQEGNAGSTKKSADATHKNALETAYAAQQTQAQRLEMVKALPQFQTSADKIALNAEKAKDLGTKLSALKDQWKQQVGAVKDAILSYDGLIRESKVTAGQVIKDLHNQVSNFKTYSSDVHRLIKAGVSPAAIQELSQKGPQYVHALASGTGRELARYKQFWKDRQSEVKGSFARSMQEQYQDLVRKMKAMQREINRLKGKTIQITARTDVQITKSVRQYLAASNIPGFHQKGTLVPGYGGGDIYPAMLEPGEAVVPKDKARRPDFRGWAGAMGIPGFQMGGLVPRYYNPTVAETRRIGISEGKVAAAVLRQLTVLPSYGGGAGSGLAMKVAQWTVAALHRSLNEAGGWYRRLMFESGGNPRAINRWDSNWVAGHPSVGIAQVIRGTFAANAGRFRGVGPFAYGVSMDPFANSFAGGHYAVGRYGSLAAVDPRVRPRGYDRGGYLPPGLSMAYNGTGRAEPVGLDVKALARELAAALRANPPVVRVDDIHAGLVGKKHTLMGGMSLGLS